MSKFYGNGSDDSSSSESEVEQRQPARKSAFNRMAVFSSDESSSDESVARAKPMKKDAFVDILRTVRGHIKNNDFTGLGADYNDALKAFEKRKDTDVIPKAFVRVLFELNSFISELQSSGATKKMSQVKAQAVNKLKAQMNKGNKPFEEELARCIENPSEYDVLAETADSDDEASDSDIESSSAASSSASETDSDTDSDSDSGSDSSNSDSDSDSSSSGSDSSDSSFASSSDAGSSDWDMSEESSSDEEVDEMARRERRMRRWLKDSDESDFEAAPKKTETVRRPKKVAVPIPNGVSTAEEGEEPEEPAKPVKTGPTPEELSEKELIEKARDLITGKVKQDDGRVTLKDLDDLIEAAKKLWSPMCHLTLSISTVSFIFDTNSGLGKNGYVPDDLLVSACERIGGIISALKSNPSVYPVSIHELVPEMVVDSDPEVFKRKRFAGNGMVSMLAEVVDDEFIKSFQALDLSEAPSVYAQRLGLLPRLISTIVEVRNFMISESQGSARMSSRLLWHLHYQSDRTLARLPELANSVSVDSLVESVFSYGSKKDKAGAILLSAFIAASRGDVVKAKRLMSADLFDLVAVSEVSLQIMYNRALAVVGVAAFAAGEVKDAYNLLTDICSTGRIRELLAQGVTRQQGNVEKSAEVDRAERRRLLPYHMHLNVELIEAAYGLSAMIMEVPNLSRSIGTDMIGASRRLGKYKRQLDSYDRQLFSGPPESAKDAIALAGKALLNDDVARAVSLVESMRIWDSMTDGETVKKRTVSLVRIAALQTYLVNNAGSHKSFSLEILSSSFGLARSLVNSSICKMILAGDVSGRITNDLFVPAVQIVSKLSVYTNGLEDQLNKLHLINEAHLESASSTDITDGQSEEAKSVLVSIMDDLADPEKDVGARRVRKAALANAKALAASQLAAEKRLQAGLAKRRGWDNARGQPLQGQVISTERKRLFGKSYGY
jgi:translation initiation factor 3 subunit C